ncbi:arylesterase [Olivibacter domesticus]|uniref:Acyl-CoA thioesterase-1 n=1 Tax=Olivibacter domesticus TaxID=407022 RepID=A0A1H7J9J4_OLID1|nr:arylesterase [Olivibacter domesticus]SEK69935.1 acyl-CoA thioesterase-1 [Olivibacter domesticus]
MQIRLIISTIVTLLSISCSNSSKEKASAEQENKNEKEVSTSTRKNILFFGNSLTAGYGLESPEEAFPARIQQKIDSLKLPYKVIGAGLSGETSAGGNERIEWVLKQPFDIFVLELGANDGLRGLATEATYQNLASIIKKVRAINPDCQIVLAGMMVPPSMGSTYVKKFQAIFPALAKEYRLFLIPFLLEGVGGEVELNQKDGIHPTSAGQKILAENVWKVLEPLLQ